MLQPNCFRISHKDFVNKKNPKKNNISESFAKLMNFHIEMKILPSLYCERLKSNIYQSLGDNVILNRRVH